MNQKPFQQAERDFFLLKGQLATKRLTRAQFDADLQKLNVRDEYGRAWRIEPENGAWEIQQNDTWIPAEPANYPAPASAPPKPASGSNNVPLFLALGAILFFCVCGIGAFALLNVTGILTTQLNLFPTTTPTFIAIVTPTPMPTSTATETLPPQTATSTIENTPTPAATNATPSVEIPETFVAFDADFFADECPLFEGSNETRAYGCDFGEYYMLHKQATTRYTYANGEYDDAVVQATGYFIDGSGKYEYGLVVRGNTDGTAYYVFTVTNDGKYNVARYQNEKYTDLIPYTESSIVNTGREPNTFKAILFGKQMLFFLNDQLIGVVPDDVLGRGVIGLFFYNAEPNTEVGFDEFTISTFTPPTPTATPNPLASATPTSSAIAPTLAVKPGVYVNSLRLAPGSPKRGQPVTFFVTFFNSTGRPQSYKWLVEIWEADVNKRNPYGQADGLQRDIPVGTNERATGDSWKVAGGGPCLPFRARVVYEDDQKRRIPFKQTNGADLWVNFQVCP